MKTITKIYSHFANDSLYKNSIFLMMSTGVMAFFGFFFWIINARLFTPEQVGIATALISVMTLISSFSLLGLGNSLIKYLPASDKKNEKINTSFTIVGLTSILICIFFILFQNFLSPELLFIRENVFFILFFILFIAFSSLNMLLDNVFIAYRSSKYVFIKNTILSVGKVTFVPLLVMLGAYGIFASMGIATISAFIFSIIFLILKFKYVFKPAINLDITKRMAKFSLGNYIAGFIGGLPALVLPIIILNNLGAKFSAYFYIDLMIANLLYIVPTAVSQSLFAEGSYSETELKTHLKKAARIISMILTPAIISTLLFGEYILLAFGKQYSAEGVLLLQILAISAIFVSINSICSSIFYIKHRVKLILLVNIIGTTVILSLSTLLIHQSLLGIGIAWLIGQGVISAIYLLLFRSRM